jgi:hypothetical protein
MNSHDLSAATACGRLATHDDRVLMTWAGIRKRCTRGRKNPRVP